MNTIATVSNAYPRPSHLDAVSGVEPKARSVSWLPRLRQTMANWAQQVAQSRAESPMWDIAQSDPRVMTELMLARKCDDSEDRLMLKPMSEMGEADTVVSVVPKASSLLGHGWASSIEDAFQARTRNAMWRHV